jgi:hypothetical protein
VEFEGVTFVGPEVDDIELLGALPGELQQFLREANGLVAYGGSLHLRGACREPAWHSPRHVWKGERAFHARYSAVGESDIPFAEDSVGDQWLLSDGLVVRLLAETGDLEETGQSFTQFLAAVERDPVETLGLHSLLQFEADGGALVPGQLLNVYPPFCVEEAARGVSLASVPAAERLDFLADLARQLPPEGQFRIRVTD